MAPSSRTLNTLTLCRVPDTLDNSLSNFFGSKVTDRADRRAATCEHEIGSGESFWVEAVLPRPSCQTPLSSPQWGFALLMSPEEFSALTSPRTALGKRGQAK